MELKIKMVGWPEKNMKILLTENVMLLEIIIMLAINKTVRKGLYKTIRTVEMLQIFSGECSQRYFNQAEQIKEVLYQRFT